MESGVKRQSPLREARKADTEQRLIDAAGRLFLRDGYAGTTLAAVASEAGVGERTVYVRFGTKADLLKRVVDVAIVGDTQDLDVAHREWAIRTMTAPTLHERVASHSLGARQLMERAGPLFAVAAQAEPIEPVIARAAQAGREATLAMFRAVWERMRDDRLLHPEVDIEWVISTVGLLGAADTYVLMTRILGWDLDTYEEWLSRTWLQFATTPGPPPAVRLPIPPADPACSG